MRFIFDEHITHVLPTLLILAQSTKRRVSRCQTSHTCTCSLERAYSRHPSAESRAVPVQVATAPLLSESDRLLVQCHCLSSVWPKAVVAEDRLESQNHWQLPRFHTRLIMIISHHILLAKRTRFAPVLHHRPTNGWLGVIPQSPACYGISRRLLRRPAAWLARCHANTVTSTQHQHGW